MPNCEHCDKPLKAIGTSRKNGKNHNDWSSRKLHKCCWKELKGQEEIIKIFTFIK